MSERSTVYNDFIREMEQRGLSREWLGKEDFLYGNYVDYLSGQGWNRETIVLNEYNLSFVNVYNVNMGTNERLVNIVCPSGCKMTIMGIKQVPDGHKMLAHSFGLHITKENGEEIPDNTKIRITKEKPSECVIQLARQDYCNIKMRNRKSVHTFHQGVEINSGTHLMIYTVNPECDISSAYVDFKMEMDFWNKD